jgi:hypothetical protein
MSNHKPTNRTTASAEKPHGGKRAQSTKAFPIDADDLLRRSAMFFGISPHATDPAARLMRRSHAWRLI